MEVTPPIRERRAALVRGVVQGVGFRPFVYRLALEESLSGFVGNDAGGVLIEIEGPPEQVEAFLARLRSEPPPLARIDSITVRPLVPTGASGFHIQASQSAGPVTTGIPADAATCPDCLRELLDPADRRYRFPFLNCTNCGPRFTITRRIPYDRPQTSMAVFPMCPACQAEYDDPLNRRFHAQPNACWSCGPRVWLETANAPSLNDSANPPTRNLQESIANSPTCDFRTAEANSPTHVSGEMHDNSATHNSGEIPVNSPTPSFDEPIANSLTRNFRAAEANSLPLFKPPLAAHQHPAEAKEASTSSHDDPIIQAIQLLRDGKIVAIKGIGGFHLAVDATNQSAVMRLRQRKHRYGKPLAVMVRDLEAARKLCTLTAEEEALLTTSARPIVLARRRPDSPIAQTLGAPGPDFGTWESIAEAVAPGIPWLGIFLPYAPLQHLLFANSCVHALVMTSANLSEEPIAIDNDEARARLGQIADAFLMHDREILQRCDDSVAAIVDGAPQLLRRARGFVPLGIALPFDAPPLLAVGGHLKNVFTLARGRFAYQSQHMGDLENLTGLDFFRESLDHLMRTFEIEPQAVVHDLHPGYLSTAWAKEWAAEHKLPLVAVQHHHAHIAGCMAEHNLSGEVIGLALDGTGYGTDGKIWGGEVLIAKLGSFQRFAHLDYVPMPGGEKAIKEPWRMAFAHLRAAGFDLETAASLAGATMQEAQLLDRMIERNVNAPQTSSLGRLFDAVAAVVLNRRIVDYEAQAAIELEGLAIDEPDRLGRQDYVPDSVASGTAEQATINEQATVKLDKSHEASGHDFSRADKAHRINMALAPAGCFSGISPSSRPFSAACEDGPLIIKTESMWKALLDDLRRGVDKKRIAARFHIAVAEGFIWAAANVRQETGINQVALSGGCMHNRRLARLLRAGLEEEGFQVYQHRNVSPGDGGLSYGQIAVAAAILQPDTA
jgi:hydrogenase maturation protein HypF